MNRLGEELGAAANGTPGEAELRTAFAARLVQTRVRRGLSQKELAARLGGDSSALSRCERGIVFPNSLTLLRIAETLGVTMDFLLTGRHAARPAGGLAPDTAILQRLEALERLAPEHLGVLLPFLDCLVTTLAGSGGRGAAGPVSALGDPGSPA